MQTTLENSQSAVAAARAAGDAPLLADKLLRHADVLLHAGRWADAAAAVDEATGLQHARGAALEEARCVRLAATLQRLQGQLDIALAHARAALDLAAQVAGTAAGGADTSTATDTAGAASASGSSLDVCAAYAELGDIALAQSDTHAALDAFDRALAPGSGAWARGSDAPAAWSRGRAKAQALAGNFEAAAGDLESAVHTLQASGDTINALRATVEAATAWQQARRFDRAQELVDAARPRASAAGDDEALAGLALLSATHALEQRDAPAARVFASAARDHALAARAATPYIGAAVALSRIDELAGNLTDAYAALATGWATLGDLLGAGLAKATFEPLLRGLRDRCGPAAFAQARSGYEQARRTP